MTSNYGLLTFKYSYCHKTYGKKFLMKIFSRDFKTSTNPVMDTLTNFVSCCQWMSIQVHVQLKKKYSRKRHYPQINFTATSRWRVLQSLTNKLKESEKTVDYKIWSNIYMYKMISCYMRRSSKVLDPARFLHDLD